MPSSIITVEQMREWETATWASGIEETDVIEQVGLKVAAWLNERTPSTDRVLLLAGKGNNGNDVRHTLPHLETRNARLIEALDPVSALEEFRTVTKAGVDWVIDGLFGIGLNRPLDDNWSRLIDEINASTARVISIDVPSGIDKEGTVQGAAIRAETTLTLGAVKEGLLRQSAIDHVGRLELIEDIGLIPCRCESTTRWITQADFGNFPPRRRPESNKGTYGHLGIIAGSEGYHGAAVLAAHAASRAQPGLVTVQTHENVYLPVACQLQSAMVRKWWADDPVVERFTCLLAGPGLAAPECEAMKESIAKAWIESEQAMIVDASALDWVPKGPLLSNAFRVITPHPGEAARMLGCDTATIQSDRMEAAARLSEEFGNCIAVLKGHQTVFAKSGEPTLVNSSGNPSLAQGGSGDILAGFIGGLLAQPALAVDPMRAVAFGVHRHGAAADELSTRSIRWPIEDLLTIL